MKMPEIKVKDLSGAKKGPKLNSDRSGHLKFSKDEIQDFSDYSNNNIFSKTHGNNFAKVSKKDTKFPVIITDNIESELKLDDDDLIPDELITKKKPKPKIIKKEMKQPKKIDYMATVISTKKLLKHQKDKKRKTLKKKIAKE